MKIFFITIFVLTSFFLSSAHAEESFSACQGTISDLKSEGLQIPINELHSGVLLARYAKVYVESPGLRLQANQNFIRAKSQVTCLSDSSHEKYKTSLTVPTLIDLGVDKSVGNSVWQFNIIVDSQQVGLWNQVSHQQSQAFKTTDLVSNTDREVFFSQLSHDQYELIIKWHSKNESKAIVVTFDSTQP